MTPLPMPVPITDTPHRQPVDLDEVGEMDRAWFATYPEWDSFIRPISEPEIAQARRAGESRPERYRYVQVIQIAPDIRMRRLSESVMRIGGDG